MAQLFPGIWRAMVIFKGSSNLPEDRYVNNWWFRPKPSWSFFAGDDVADEALAILNAFYLTPAASGQALVTQFNQAAISGMELRVYDMGKPAPREPFVRTMEHSWGTAMGKMPTECAAVLSFRSARTGPRGKGRIYLGPLGEVGVTSNARPFVSQNLRNIAVDRATDVMNTSRQLNWVQLSTTDGQFGDVTGGWIDDAIDIQRKRGAKPSMRNVFGSAYVLAA